MTLDLVKELTSPEMAFKNFKYVGRNVKNEDTIIRVGNVNIGGKNFTVMAGPCSVESKEQLFDTASAAKKHGAVILRGGAFKPRTSPYTFQGLGQEGLTLLALARREFSMPVVSEILDAGQLNQFKDIDILQVGAKNMQNFSLLKALGTVNKPVLLKRGFSNSLEEFLFSAEYIISSGNPNVILCERGIRTFETSMRNTLDVCGISLLRQLTHLPVIADPSHSTGLSRLVEPASIAATAAGAQGLIIEIHNSPEDALCDGMQAIGSEEFARIVKHVTALLPYSYGRYK